MVCSMPPPLPPPPAVSVYESVLPASIGYHCSGPPEHMPLIKHFVEGSYDNGPAWHRNEERRARNLGPATSMDLEDWERELAQMEIMLLIGNPAADFELLERAWGQEPGFYIEHSKLCCETRAAKIVQQKSHHRQLPSLNSTFGNFKPPIHLRPNHRRQMSSLASIPMSVWDDPYCKEVGSSNMDVFDFSGYATANPAHNQQHNNDGREPPQEEVPKVVMSSYPMRHQTRGEPYTDETEGCTSASSGSESSSSGSERDGDDEWAIAVAEQVVW
jgi:hypothetical protein